MQRIYIELNAFNRSAVDRYQQIYRTQIDAAESSLLLRLIHYEDTNRYTIRINLRLLSQLIGNRCREYITYEKTFYTQNKAWVELRKLMRQLTKLINSSKKENNNTYPHIDVDVLKSIQYIRDKYPYPL